MCVHRVLKATMSLFGSHAAGHRRAHADGRAGRAGVGVAEADGLVDRHAAGLADGALRVVRFVDVLAPRGLGLRAGGQQGRAGGAGNCRGAAARFQEYASAELDLVHGVSSLGGWWEHPQERKWRAMNQRQQNQALAARQLGVRPDCVTPSGRSKLRFRNHRRHFDENAAHCWLRPDGWPWACTRHAPRHRRCASASPR